MFSRFPSGAISPSDLPDSPNHTVPPSPKRSRPPSQPLKTPPAQGKYSSQREGIEVAFVLCRLCFILSY